MTGPIPPVLLRAAGPELMSACWIEGLTPLVITVDHLSRCGLDTYCTVRNSAN